MDDLEAIRLFVRDGGVAGEWHAVDQRVRNHYEKLALGGAEPAAIPSGLAAGPVNANPFASSDGLGAKTTAT